MSTVRLLLSSASVKIRVRVCGRRDDAVMVTSKTASGPIIFPSVTDSSISNSGRHVSVDAHLAHVIEHLEPTSRYTLAEFDTAIIPLCTHVRSVGYGPDQIMQIPALRARNTKSLQSDLKDTGLPKITRVALPSSYKVCNLFQFQSLLILIPTHDGTRGHRLCLPSDPLAERRLCIVSTWQLVPKDDSE